MNAITETSKLDIYAGLDELTQAITAIEEHVCTLSNRLHPVMRAYKTDGETNAPKPVLRCDVGDVLSILAGRVYGVRRQVLDMMDALQI